MSTRTMAAFGSVLVSLALCTETANTSNADDVFPTRERASAAATAESPGGGYYREIGGGSGPNVLLLDDANNAGTAALITALTTAGFNVTHRIPPEFTWDTTDPPLDDFACVVHLNGFAPFTPLPVASQIALNEFVREGGGFIGSQWNGFEREVNQQVNMNDLVLQLWPGPDNCGGCNMTWTAVGAQAGHPVLDSIPASFTFFADGHDAGALVIFGTDPSTVLMTSPGGGPAVMVREFENGRVVNFSCAANFFTQSQTLQDPIIQQLYVNAAKYVCNRVIEIEIDIKPGSCPNSFNRNSNGVLPVALVGDPAFDVGQVDLTTVQLERADDIGGSVQPNEGPPGPHSVVEDVATPFNGDLCGCHDLTGDGIDDLSMKFKSQEVVAALELNDLPPGALVELCVSGELLDGTEFEACDCVRLVPPGDIDGDGLVGVADLLRLLAQWGQCGPTAECSADYNGDTMVGVVDLLIMLGNWS